MGSTRSSTPYARKMAKQFVRNHNFGVFGTFQLKINPICSGATENLKPDMDRAGQGELMDASYDCCKWQHSRAIHVLVGRLRKNG